MFVGEMMIQQSIPPFQNKYDDSETLGLHLEQIYEYALRQIEESQLTYMNICKICKSQLFLSGNPLTKINEYHCRKSDYEIFTNHSKTL